MVNKSSNSTGSKWLICAPLTTFSRHKTAKPFILGHWNNMVEHWRAHFLLRHKWDLPVDPKQMMVEGGHWTTGTCWQRMEEMTLSVWRVAKQINVLCHILVMNSCICEFICWISLKLMQSLFSFCWNCFRKTFCTASYRDVCELDVVDKIIPLVC